MKDLRTSAFKGDAKGLQVLKLARICFDMEHPELNG
jgi:hypothetical protein